LFAEVSAVGLHDVEELCDYGGDAAEMAGPERAFHAFAYAADVNERARLVRVHLFEQGRKDEVRSARCTEGQIVIERARISIVVAGLVELDGIDENADHDEAVPGARAFDKPRVAFVQRAHGGHQADGKTAGAGFCDLCAHRRDAVRRARAHSCAATDASARGGASVRLSGKRLARTSSI